MAARKEYVKQRSTALGRTPDEPRVAVIDDKGQLQSIPTSQLANARANGWNLDAGAIGEALAAKSVKRDQETLGARAATFGEAALASTIDIGATPLTTGARVAAAGLESVGGIAASALDAIGYGDQARTALDAASVIPRELRAFGETATGRGTVTGIGGLVGDGELGEAEREYKAASRQLGEANPYTAMGGYAVPQVAAGFALAPLGGGAAVGAEAGLGFLQGLGQANETAYLTKGTAATAEALASDGLLGAALGGGLTGAFMGAGWAGRRAIRGLFGEAGTVATKVATEGAEAAADAAPTPPAGMLGDDAARAADAAVGGADDVPVGQLAPEDLVAPLRAAMGTEPSPGLIRRAIDWVQDRSPLVKSVKQADEAKAQLDSLHAEALPMLRNLEDTADELRPIITGDGKAQTWAKLLPTENRMEQFETVATWIDNADNELAALEARAVSKQARTAIAARRKFVRQQYNELVQNSDDQAKVYVVADRLKRDADEFADSFAASGRRAQDPNFGLDAERIAPMVRERIADPMRQMLESRQIWGAAGEAQQVSNRNWHDLIPKAERYGRGYQTKFEDRYMIGAKYRTASDKLMTGLRSFGKRGAEDAEEALIDYVDAQVKQFTEVAETAQLSAGMRAKAQRALEDAKTLRDKLTKSRESLRAYAQIEELAAQESPELATAAAVLTGGSAPATAAVYAFVRPTSTARTLLRIGAAGEALERRTGEVIRAFLGGKAKPVARAAETAAEAAPVPPAGVLGSVSPDGSIKPRKSRVRSAAAAGYRAASAAAVPLSIVAMGSDRRKRRQEYERKAERISQLAANPMQRAAEIERLTRNVSRAAPQTALGIGDTLTRAVDYLHSAMPGGKQLDGLTPQLSRFEASDAEISRWGLVYNTVTNPMSVFDDLDRGTLTFEQRDALRAVYPELYGMIQRQTIEALADQTEPVPYQKALQLGTLLDLGAGAHPALAPDFQQRQAQLAAQSTNSLQSKQAPSGQRPPRLANRFRTNALEEMENV